MKKFFGTMMVVVLAIFAAAAPSYASDSGVIQWSSDDTVMINGSHSDSDGAIPVDISVFYNGSDGIVEVDAGGGYCWRLNEHFSVTAESYVAWRDNKDLSMLLFVSPSCRGKVFGLPYSVTVPAMRYLGDGSDDGIILSRVRGWLEITSGVRLGMIMKGNTSTNNFSHGPFLELPGFPNEDCTLQAGCFDPLGDNPSLVFRLICTTN